MANYDFNDAQQRIAYNADGTVAYIEVTLTDGRVYRQTFTYTSGNLTAVSQWVKQ